MDIIIYIKLLLTHSKTMKILHLDYKSKRLSVESEHVLLSAKIPQN